MAYLSELRTQWRPLLAATIGMGSGFSITNYVTTIMAPHLIAEFGWSRSEFALVGSLGIVAVFLFPFVGRLADLIGVRRTALIGVIALPISFVGLYAMNGSIGMYIALFLVQGTLCITTTATVYSRTVVQYVVATRGLALAIVASGPALTGMIGGPLLNDFVAAHGWRAGYAALVAFSTLAGASALLLLPADRKPEGAPPPRVRTDYREIVRNRSFWVLLTAMLLCNLPQVIALTQLNLLLLDNGVPAGGVSAMISIFAGGVLAGRFVSGVALDRLPAHLVAAVGLGLPAIGLLLFASSLDATPVLMLSVLLIGLSFGAEGDVVGYLVVRNFGVRIYGSVMGLMTAAIAISSSIGAIALSAAIRLTGGFDVFLVTTAIAVVIGATILLWLPSPALSDRPAR